MSEMVMEWGDQEIPIKVLEFETDLQKDNTPIAMFTNGTIEGTVTITVDTTYYRVMKLASLLDKHSPKKAKWIRERFERLNPLRKMGLL